MAELFNFGGQSKELAFTATTARIALAAGIGAAGSVLRIFNDSDVTAFVALGDSTVAAVIPTGSTLGAIPIAAGRETGITVKGAPTHIAAIAASGSGNLYITQGNGI